MKRFSSYFEGWRGIVLMAYLWLIMMGYALLYINVPSNETMNKLSTESLNFYYFIEVAEFLLLLTAFISPLLIRFARKWAVEPDGHTPNTWYNSYFWRFFFTGLAILLVYYAAFYPGGFSPDTTYQYAQAIGRSKYNDAHPVLETLLMVTLPLKLSGGWVGAPALFHVLVAAFTIAYASSTAMQYGNKKYALFFFWYTILNPAVGLGTAYIAYKDMSFALVNMLAMSFAVHIYFTKGLWLKKFSHIIMLALTLTCATIFRHNGILFTFPLLVGILFCAGKKNAKILLLWVCVLIFAVKVPLYSFFDIQKPGSRHIETLGFVMTITGDAVKYTPERIDSEVRDFIYTYADKETWERINMGPGMTFGFIKHSMLNRNSNIIEETDRIKAIKFMLHCIVRSPYVCLRSFIGLTDLVWGIAGFEPQRINMHSSKNNLGLEMKGIPFLRKILTLYDYGTRVLLKHVYSHIGVVMLVLLIVLLAKLNFNTSQDWKKFTLVIPMFIHNYGTMMFLTHNDFRYFFYSFLVFPLMLLLLLRKDEETQS